MNLTVDFLFSIVDTIDKACISLFNTLKYVYIISSEDFYNINIKDLLKVALNDITNPDALENLGIRFEREKLGDMNSSGFDDVLKIIKYSVAIRLPFLKNLVEEIPIKNSHIKEMYNMMILSGAENCNQIITSDFSKMQWLAKTKNEPEFETEWFRKWVFSQKKELSILNNRNIFLFGAVDVIFPLYYSALQQEIGTVIIKAFDQ